MSEFLETMKAEALATDEGKAFAAAGFELYANGGGCIAWRKVFEDGRYILITNDDGASHALQDNDDSFLVGFYSSPDDTDPDSSYGHNTAVDAIAAAAYFAGVDRWEIAARRAGWVPGDVPGQLNIYIAGATIPNVFFGDWEAVCRNQGIAPYAEAEKIGVDVWIAGTIYVDANDDAEAAKIVAERYAGSLSNSFGLDMLDGRDIPLEGDDFLSSALTLYGVAAGAALLPANDPVRAAAPEILAALIALVATVETALDAGLLLSVDGNRPDIMALKDARAAIATAEGRANG